MTVESKGKVYSYEVTSSVPQYSPFQTLFNEQVVTSVKSIFNLKSTWGVSDLRDLVELTGATSLITSSFGEMYLHTDPSTGSLAKLQSQERGQYIAGAVGEIGIGVRVATRPVGSQEVYWGYFDDVNGLGYGCDVTGTFVFSRNSGDTTKIYQQNWNVDKVTGSVYNLDTSFGNIYHINFSWYGYGSILYDVISSFGTDAITRRTCHIINPVSMSIGDPNQPITIEARNGASTSSSLDVYVGGRQFSLFSAYVEPQTRIVDEFVSNYTVAAAQGVWQPILAIRRKASHRGKPNSVRCFFGHLDILADNSCEFRVMYGAVTSGGTYRTPSDWTDTESAVEAKVITSGSFTSTGGLAVLRGILTANKNDIRQLTETTKIIFGNEKELVVSVRRTTSNATVISSVINWEEQW